MDEELTKLIDDKLDSIDPSFENIYNSTDELDEMIKNQNDKVKYRSDLLKALNILKEKHYDVEFNDKMSIEELENILNNVNI